MTDFPSIEARLAWSDGVNAAREAIKLYGVVPSEADLDAVDELYMAREKEVSNPYRMDWFCGGWNEKWNSVQDAQGVTPFQGK